MNGDLSRRDLIRVRDTVRKSEETLRFGSPQPIPRNRTQVLVQLVSPTADADVETGLYPAVWHRYDRAGGTFPEQSGCWIADPNAIGLTTGDIYIGRCVATHPTDGLPVYAVAGAIGSSESGSGSGSDPGDDLVELTFLTGICVEDGCEGGGGGDTHPPVTIAEGLDYAEIDEETQVVTLNHIDADVDIDFASIAAWSFEETDKVIILDVSAGDTPKTMAMAGFQNLGFWNPYGANLTSGHIWLGGAGDAAQPVAMSGDATISNTGVVTLANSGVTAASYGGANSFTNFTVDAKGRLTAASTVALPTATSGSDEAAAFTDIVADATWYDTGAEFTPGSSGTYLLYGLINYRLLMTSGIGSLLSRLQNVTDGTTVSGSGCLLILANDTVLRQQSIAVNLPPSALTAGKTYRLQVSRGNVSSASFFYADVSSGSGSASGRTFLGWAKLSG